VDPSFRFSGRKQRRQR